MMVDVKNKRIFVNKHQKQALVEYIQRNPVLKNPSKLSNKLSKKNINKLWDDLASHLNKIGEITGGAIKDAQTWKKTWQDMKCNVKKKVAETRKYEMGTGGGPPLPVMDVESNFVYEEIKDILEPLAIEGDDNVLESEVVFEIVEEPETVNEFEEDVEPEVNLEEPTPSIKATTVPNKSKRLTAALQVSTKISEEIATKTNLKQQYYSEKLQILKEKLELKKQDIEVKREISTLLTQIVQHLKPSDPFS